MVHGLHGYGSSTDGDHTMGGGMGGRGGDSEREMRTHMCLCISVAPLAGSYNQRTNDATLSYPKLETLHHI